MHGRMVQGRTPEHGGLSLSLPGKGIRRVVGLVCLLSAHRREHAAGRSVVALGAPCDGFGAYYATRAWVFLTGGEPAAPLVVAAPSGYLIDKHMSLVALGDGLWIMFC
jgi:hypothetical protein